MTTLAKRSGRDQEKLNNEKRRRVDVEPLVLTAMEKEMIGELENDRKTGVQETISEMYWTGGSTLIEPCNAGKSYVKTNINYQTYIISFR